MDDYYRELGIDPTEMKPKAGDEELYKTQAKQKKKQERVEAEDGKRRAKSAVLDQMMETARKHPNAKTLGRLI